MTELHEKYLQGSLDRLPAGSGGIEAAWRSPSNIALVKYWGKTAVQIPGNPSLSFSLEHAVTEMRLALEPSAGHDFSMGYFFEGKENQAFAKRIKGYLESVFPYFPFLRHCRLEIQSSNTFPHSSGIASSASSMSALALCLCTIEEKVLGRKQEEDFFMKASYMARLGSGSASRSVYGGFTTWGEIEGLAGTSNEFATKLGSVPGKSFDTLHDAVLIVSPHKKKVSSTRGHAMMDTHPFAAERYRQSNRNILELIRALEKDDVMDFIRITENEALTLHGLMMSSDPGFILLEPGTLEIVRALRGFRDSTGIFLTFTIDAGPNVHLIYPASEREPVLDFIQAELLPFCHEKQWIDDGMGNGPEEIN